MHNNSVLPPPPLKARQQKGSAPKCYGHFYFMPRKQVPHDCFFPLGRRMENAMFQLAYKPWDSMCFSL